MEKKYQIFISSTYEDLKEERRKVQDAILAMYHFPIGMEMFSAADKEQWEVIKETIDSSDYYILIIANRYGSIIEKGKDKGISYTEKEYKYAKRKGIPVLAFIIDSSVPRTTKQMETNLESKKKLDKFINNVKGRMIEFWTSSDDLVTKVITALTKEFSKSRQSGWIKATNYVESTELDEARKEIQRLKEANEKLSYMSYELQPMFVEALNLKDMRCFVSQNNKLNKIIVLENEYNRSSNGHIIYFNNNGTSVEKLKDEFIMLAYIYPENQNWVKYYYNNYGLFFSIRGSGNISKVQVEIKEKNTSLICVLHREFSINESKSDFFIRLRDCDIRQLSNIKEICFTIYNNFYNNFGKCELEVCDVWIKQLPNNLL